MHFATLLCFASYNKKFSTGGDGRDRNSLEIKRADAGSNLLGVEDGVGDGEGFDGGGDGVDANDVGSR